MGGGELSARNILRKEMHGTKFNHGSPIIISLDENMVASVAKMLLPEENKGQSAFLLSNIFCGKLHGGWGLRCFCTSYLLVLSLCIIFWSMRNLFEFYQNIVLTPPPI